MPMLRHSSHALQAVHVIEDCTDKEFPVYSGFSGLIPPNSDLVL